MRAQEFIVEAVSRANDIDHFRSRVRQVVQLLEPIGDHPLVYREFRHKIGAETAVLKVSNDRKEFTARSGSNSKQSEVLRALGIKNPVFCTMQTPYSTDGFFGGANIFVPGADYRVVWSPVVKDLGGNDIVGPDSDRYGHQDLGGGVSRLGSDRLVGAEFAKTYQSGWPPGYTSNELIFDCDSYYLLNIKDFLRRFAGKQNRDIVHRRDRINQEVFNAKFSTYGDIVWYLSNTLPKYLDWYEANVVANKTQQEVAEGSDQITELRDRMYQYIKSVVPTWPDYVVKDWLYANQAKPYGREATITPADKTFGTLKTGIPEMLADVGLTVDTKWQLVPDMKFTMDMWEPKTRRNLEARAGGKPTELVPSTMAPSMKDAERHATQATLAKQQGGVRKEPVIIVKTPQGYELLEGWHRTIQHFAQYPDGYVGPAYVAIAGAIQENFADGRVKGKSRPGRVKRAGASCNGSVTDLRRKAKNASGERARMYHWCANMKSGKKK